MSSVFYRLPPVALVLFLDTSAAFAEVCDKIVGENWNLGDGPVSLVTPISNLLWPSIVISICLFSIFVWRLKKTAFTFSCILFLVGVAGFLDQPYIDDFYASAYSEGCLSLLADRISSITLIFVSIIFFVSGKWLQRSAK
jgi:hypothetical protein